MTQLSVVSCQLSSLNAVNSQQSTPSTIPIPNSQCPIIDNLACGKTCGK
ncbi:hypothetical protein [Phormidium nigroviride]|nr:hypothetical protein [Oscillatoria nigro-viridis]